jgi:hypothetical protein
MKHKKISTSDVIKDDNWILVCAINPRSSIYWNKKTGALFIVAAENVVLREPSD